VFKWTSLIRLPLITLPLITLLLATLLLASSGCSENSNWNNPHTDYSATENNRYSVFSEPPKTLDPARSYSSNEVRFTGQIVEPPLQYHYLKRPYQLIPLTATALPTVVYLDKEKQVIDDATANDKIAFTVYTITLKPGIRYQPHPAFSQDKTGRYRYHHLKQAKGIQTLSDFTEVGTRELTADDYIYQIKRLASPDVRSPIFGLMSRYIVGLKKLNKTLTEYNKRHQGNHQERSFVDLRQFPLDGVKRLSPYSYQITLTGQYPQFQYWLAMPFFAPIPWQADAFYSQYVLRDKNITLDWYPTGTSKILTGRSGLCQWHRSENR